jgi:hypothetical protein
LHRGWKGILNSFSKKFFSKSAYKDKNSQRTQILCMNDYIKKGQKMLKKATNWTYTWFFDKNFGLAQDQTLVL